MGLSKSKASPGRGGRGAERKRGRRFSGPPPPAPPDRPAQGSEAAAPGAAPRREEKPDGKVKVSKKKLIIPQIVVTRASQETLLSYNSATADEQRTIKEEGSWGPYYRHRNPSTVAAYNAHAE